jgi:hypothetical protein
VCNLEYQSKAVGEVGFMEVIVEEQSRVCRLLEDMRKFFL